MTIELNVEVLRLLSEQVTSYEQLEALLLLHAAPGRDWAVAEVAATLHIDAGNAAGTLAALTAQRLLAVKGIGVQQRYRYAPADDVLAAGVDKLARSYVERRLEVVKQMSANAIERVRVSAARAFADAFLLGDKKGNRDRDDR